MASRGPVLGLDLGAKRIGLAVSDLDGAIAFPVGFLARRGAAHDLAALDAMVRERQIQKIVVGLPIHLDGRVGEEARAARAFGEALAEATGVPVEMLDERWTTVEAERSLRGTRTARKREAVDAVAATLLLRTWLAREAALESH